MQNLAKKTCCFFGHRKIVETEELVERIVKTVEELIVERGVNTFFFGSKSQFDELCYKVVSRLKEKYPQIKRVYIRAENAVMSEKYENYILNIYEETYYPEKIRNAGKAVYVERNKEMIDKSKFCVVYYDKYYAPPIRRNSKRELSNYQPKSGTSIAYEYALNKKKEIINLK